MKSLFMKSDIDSWIWRSEVSLYERFYKKFILRKTVVRSGYRVVLTRRYYRWLKKHDPGTISFTNLDDSRVLQEFDLDDLDEINYMMRCMLNDPKVRCYVVYNDGHVRRIKLGRFRK